MTKRLFLLIFIASFLSTSNIFAFNGLFNDVIQYIPSDLMVAPIHTVATSDSVTAQSDTVAPADTIVVKPWQLGGWTTLNVTQASYRNWSQGGVNNIAGISSARFIAEYKMGRHIFENATNMKYGKARIDGAEYRKTDDEFRIRNQYRYLLDDPRYSLIAQFNFNTQFDKGFDKEFVTVISKFMAPGYFIETVGFAFNPGSGYQFDMGISLKQTVVADTSLSVRYGLKPGEQSKNEGGISLGMKAEQDIATNVILMSQVETFTNYLKPVSSTTILFTNEIVGKINNFLTANLQLVLAYDDNITTELQVKQVISIGFNYKFL
jgi:hypothetical protein